MSHRAYDGSEIAVCGLSARFPGAPDVATYWANLRAGVESIRFFSDDELREAGEEPERIADPDYVKARPVLEGIELFDAPFFGFAPREAEILDPQARLFLECAWHALEDAGYDSERYPGAIGLFAGCSLSHYLLHNLHRNRPAMEAFGDFEATIYNVHDSLVTLAGYKLNLRGPCCAVQTFCSTSLVSVHLACQSLLSYESEVALAGGVTVYVPQTSGYLHQEGSITSRDGHCRPFDAAATGTVFGSGVGVVVLRRLADALEEGDTVHAVIRGSAVNNDGSKKLSYSAPGVVGQTEVVVEALAAADVPPETIGYVEAHGTGTLLGDPAEVRALTNAYRRRTDARGFCALGSVKSNVGHLDAAAGVAGLIKMVLALRHREIPPIAGCDRPNPEIDFEASPFFLSRSLRPWEASESPRRGGVSAFGVGGTNAHVILEEAPEQESRPSTRTRQLLVLSARSPEALDAAASRLARHLEAHAELDLGDVAFTLQVGRRAFDHRRALVCASREEAVAALTAGGRPASPQERRNPPMVLLFDDLDDAGPGAIGEEPLLRREVAEVAAVAGAGARKLLETAPGAAEARRLRHVVAQLAVAAALEKCGVRPAAVTGRGLGAVAAACRAGAIDVARALEGLAESREASAGEAVELARALAGFRREEGRVPWLAASGEPMDAGRQDETAFWESALCGDSEPAEAVVDGRLVVRVGAGSARVGEAGAGRLLDALGHLWLEGADVDWPALYPGERRRRVSLPGYPFERQRYWVAPVGEEPGPDPLAKRTEPTEWLYLPAWKQLPHPPVPLEGEPGRCLLFAGEGRLARAVGERLAELGAEVVRVRQGAEYAGDPAVGYTIDPRTEADYVALWRDLGSRGRLPDRIVHLWGADALEDVRPGERLDRACERGAFSLLHLIHAIGASDAPLRIDVVTSGVCDVVGNETLEPEKAAVLAMARVIPQEYEGVHVRLVDLDTGGGDDPEGVEALVEELRAGGPARLVALRGGRRWVRQHEPVGTAQRKPKASPVKDGAAFLVTGGLGGVGFSLAFALAKMARVRLVLLGRSAMPERDAWRGWIDGHAADDPTSVRIRRMAALESAAEEALYVQADVSDAEQLGRAVAAARERCGRFDGVVHAAGLLAADTLQPLASLTTEAFERQLAPKVRGLLNLQHALAADPPEYWTVTSSLSSLLGGVGYGAYASANVLLDALAAAHRGPRGSCCVSVNWDHWRFGEAGEGSAEASEYFLTAKEGARAFAHVLRLGPLPRVLVSTGPLDARVRRWVLLKDDERTQPTRGRAAGAESGRPRPALGVPFLAPRDEIERRVAEIWEELLGIHPVGVHDDFFELGGHSLFAARILARIRARLGVSLSIEAVLEAPTVEGLAGRVSAATWARDSDGPGDAGSDEQVEIEL